MVLISTKNSSLPSPMLPAGKTQYFLTKTSRVGISRFQMRKLKHRRLSDMPEVTQLLKGRLRFMPSLFTSHWPCSHDGARDDFKVHSQTPPFLTIFTPLCHHISSPNQQLQHIFALLIITVLPQLTFLINWSGCLFLTWHLYDSLMIDS